MDDGGSVAVALRARGFDIKAPGGFRPIFR